MLGVDVVGDADGDDDDGATVGGAALGALVGDDDAGAAVGPGVAGDADGAADGAWVMSSLQSSPRWLASQAQLPLLSTAPPPLQSTASLYWHSSPA